MSRLGIVLTLAVNEDEGHRAYHFRSAYPAKGTTVGGRSDDPRRDRTRNAPARHRARTGARQRQRGVSGAGHFADAVLSLAQASGAVRDRRRASAPATSPAGPAGEHAAGGGASGPGDRDQHGALGLPPDRRLPG